MQCNSLSIMGKTAVLTVVQKTITDTPHRRSLRKKLAVCRMLYQSIMRESWLEGESVVGKCAQATSVTTALRGLSRKVYSRTWQSFTRSGFSVDREPLHMDIYRKLVGNWFISNIKSLLNQRQHQKHLTWANETTCWTVA